MFLWQTDSSLLALMGIRLEGLIPAVVLPLLLTMVNKINIYVIVILCVSEPSAALILTRMFHLKGLSAPGTEPTCLKKAHPICTASALTGKLVPLSQENDFLFVFVEISSAQTLLSCSTEHVYFKLCSLLL